MLTSLFSTDRSLQMAHDVLLLRQIARDPLHALSHRHDYAWTAFIEPVNNMLVGLYLSVTNRSNQAQAWMACFTDGKLTIMLFPRPLLCHNLEEDVDCYSKTLPLYS